MQQLTEQEKGPLRYIAGAVMSKLYRKIKKVKNITQIQSCKIFCFRCAFIKRSRSYIDQEGLCGNSCELLVTINETVEIIF